MVFIVKKKIHGREYFYLNENKRVEGKVKTKTLTYLGKTREEAEKKAKEFLSKLVAEKSSKGKMDKEDKENPMDTKQKKEISIDDLATFCKRKGFVYPSGEIYGGLSGFWDFGPLGVELKNNIKREWWKFHVLDREDVVGVDGSIITSPKTWEASGHLKNFSDLFVVCKKCKKLRKIDKNEISKVKCDNCGGDYDFSTSKEFKLMFETNVGEGGKAFLRPETAQLIFTNFKSIFENSRLKLPCGIAQIGKAFRNEIAPRDFLFRSREFEQMELEYFVNPLRGKDKCPYEIPDVEVLVLSAEAQKNNSLNSDGKKMRILDALKKGIIKKDWHAYWLAIELSWFVDLGANPNNFRIRQHSKEELSHYSSDTWDLEYKFPFGWKELEGIADRGDFDLGQHEKFSGKDLKIFDGESKEKILPHVICEPSLGVERAFLVFMLDSYFYDEERQNIILRLHPKLSPIKAAVFPIVRTNEKIVKMSEEVYKDLKKEFPVIYDEVGSVGRRYARNDEIGTPFCITFDGDSIKGDDVTIRDRDTKKQIRVPISNLREILRKLINREIQLEKAGKLFYSVGKGNDY